MVSVDVMKTYEVSAITSSQFTFQKTVPSVNFWSLMESNMEFRRESGVLDQLCHEPLFIKSLYFKSMVSLLKFFKTIMESLYNFEVSCCKFFF